MSDPLKDLCDMLAESGMRFVFWVCPHCPGPYVEWNEDKTVATCMNCGTKSSDKNPLDKCDETIDKQKPQQPTQEEQTDERD